MYANKTFVVSIILSGALTVFPQLVIGDTTSPKLVQRSAVEFIPLNPLRGDRSPKSGKLWGDIRANEASGMLVTFRDGFQSPPHIHNITYRAVVISGEVHNDDPGAEKMWMGSGSFWTQPKGEIHITAAKGKNTTIFLEILSGPYLVKPAKYAFDEGERPINMDTRNIIWLGSTDTSRIEGSGPHMAYLWGKPEDKEKNGSFIKLPSGYSGKLKTSAPLMRVVTIKGVVEAKISGQNKGYKLEPGSYFGSRGKAEHRVTCTSDKECVLYLHTQGKYKLAKS